MRPAATGPLVLWSALFLTACDGAPPSDTDTDTDTADVGTEDDGFDTGMEAWGLGGEATVSGGSSYTGHTEIFDVVVEDGPLGARGDLLCQYVYPTTGAPFALTQPGVDGANEPVTLACPGCDFAFELSHQAPTTIGEGDFCQHLYQDTGWDVAFPIDQFVVGFASAWDDPDTVDVEADPAMISFYDGSGSQTETNADGETVEVPAQWYAAGNATYNASTGAFQWTQILAYYKVWELAYYEQ